jgi:hypothetical protein
MNVYTLEEYISIRKREEKIDEFNFKENSHNMAAAIRYVTDYCTNYLDFENYNEESIKIVHFILNRKLN